jgi:two-component system cell cycle response regulator DivK
MSTVLIVEDNLSNAEMMIRILESAGYEVNHFVEGLKGAAAARKTRPDIILMDFDLPDINGRNLILVLSKQLPDTPIIAVTAHVGEGKEQLARRFGCVDYVAKPFEPQYLLDVVQMHLKKKPISSEQPTDL